MKQCAKCVYLTEDTNIRYCMFFSTPKCPGDDGTPEPQKSLMEQAVEKVKERGIEMPKPYPRTKSDYRSDRYFNEHEKICRMFYIEGLTYQEIADELGDNARARGVRAYIIKCEKYHDSQRRLKSI